jgi:integrase/recombinase XerD
MRSGELVLGWCAHQRVRGLSVETIRRRRWSIEEWLKHVAGDATAGSTLEVERFLARWDAPLTRHAVLSDVHLFYDWAISRELLDCPDPTRLVHPVRKPKRVPTPIAADDVRRLIDGLVGPVQVMVMLGAMAGLRVMEIAALHGPDVSHHHRTITVRDGKGGKDRIVPMAAELGEALDPRPNGRYFPGLSADGVSYRIRTQLRRNGINGRPHDLRASFGTELARLSGGNLVLVARLMGHESMETTKRYIGWLPEGADLVGQLFAA